jgi:glycosyltransferase involved in cell wall biosynthesis
LLVNEASGIHSLLKQGFLELGHDVTHAIAGHSSLQGRTADVYLGYMQNNLLGKVKRNILPLWKIEKLKGVDIVNYILGISAFSGKYIKYRDLSIFKRANAKLSYIGTGCDEASLMRIRPDAEDLPCKSCQTYDLLDQQCKKSILGYRDKAARFAGLFDYTIAPVVEYDHCHEFFPNAIHEKIPLPINVRALEFMPADPAKKKPLIIHSPTRRKFKGTHVVIEAIKIVGDQYRDFEFELVEGLSYEDYLNVMKRCDIYIDQVFSHSTGMAALENLAMGKIVLSGNTPDAMNYFVFSKESTIINAAPDPTKLAETLINILTHREHFENIALRGRHFIEKYHDHVQVARQYLNLWQRDPDIAK